MNLINFMMFYRIETIDGTAEATKDYHPVKQTMVFEKDETYKFIDIEIVDDNEWEPDEVFFVKLTLVDSTQMALIGKKSIMEITIINDDGLFLLLYVTYHGLIFPKVY